MRKLVILLIIFVVTFVNCIYSTPLPYNDKIFDMTIGEAKKLSPNNNPLDVLIEYREKYGQDVFDNYYNYIPTEPGEYEGVDLYIGDANYDINEEIKNGIDTIITKYEIKDKNSNILNYLVVIIILLVLTILLYAKFKKKRIFILSILLLIVLILLKFMEKRNYENCNNLYIYLKSKGIEISDNTIKSEQNFPFKKMDIAYEINQFIDDLNDINYEKGNGKQLFFDEFSKALGEEYLGKDDKQICYNYLEKEKMLYKGINENTEYINKIRKIQPIIYYDIADKMEDIYERNFNDYTYLSNLINKININVDISEAKDIDNVFEYAKRIGASRCLNWKKGYEIVSYFKDWYIEGDDKIIELPYGMYLHYKAPKLLKKDVKEIVAVNINELDPLSEENILKVFYLDSNDNLKYDFTICKFIEEDGKQKLYYEPYTILYDVRCASTVFSMHKELEYIDNRPDGVLVKKY